MIRARAALLLCCVGLAGCGDRAPPVLEGRPAGPYRLSLTLDPPRPQPDADTVFHYRLTHAADESPVRDLRIVHERLIHTFIVAEDFSSFAHLHHEDFAPLAANDVDRASFRFPYRFPHAGRYRVVAEFTHRDRSWVKHFDLVAGDPAAPATARPDFGRVRRAGAYTATLHLSPDPPVAGHEAELVLELARDGAPVTDLELRLGAEIHVAVWRADGEHFGHTHSYTPAMAATIAAMRGHAPDARHAASMMLAMMATPAQLVYPGPRIPIRHTFPTAGVYRVFMEVAPRGEVRVFAFAIEVRPYRDGMDTRVHSMVSATGP